MLNLCAERDRLTPTPLQIGLTPNAGPTTPSTLWLIEATDARQIAEWVERLHAHHAHAALILNDPNLLSTQDLRALPGLGLWPIFTAGPEPLTTRSPAEIARLIHTLPSSPRLLMPRPNALQIASDALTLDTLARHGVQHLIVPEVQVTGTSHDTIMVTRHRAVDLERDDPEHLLAWLDGDRLEQARSGARTLGLALIEGAHDLRKRAARKSRR